MPLLPGNCCIFGATVFSTARIPPFEIAMGEAGIGLNEIERAARDRFAPDEAAMPKARSVFEELAPLLGEQPFFAGEAISLPDLLVAPQLAFFRMTPEWDVLSTTHSNLVAWLARMEARPSFKATTWERVSEMAQAA